MSVNGSDAPAHDGQFHRRLTVVTFSVLLVVLVIDLLQRFKEILPPLLIAALVAYAILPVHRWLVRRGVRSALAYVLILSILVAALLATGNVVYDSISSMTPQRIATYKEKVLGLEGRAASLLTSLGVAGADDRLRRTIEETTVSNEDVVNGLHRVAGTFFDFLTFALIVFIYLVFMLAEKLTFPRRLSLAFGDSHAGNLLQLTQAINDSIVQYIAVKTWISLVTAVLSLVVYLSFGIEFAYLWAFLLFLLNFIPYLGGIVAMAPPILLAFLMSDSFLPGLGVIALLTGIQLFTGQFVEPRMAGNRLNLSPLLILLSLAFWGFLWGIPGMLLAVPLTVVCKIVLDHIPETRPIGTLMSNL